MASRAVLQSVQRLVALEQRAQLLAQRLRLAQAEATESHARHQLRDLLAAEQLPPPPSAPSPPQHPPQPPPSQSQPQPPTTSCAVDAAAAGGPLRVVEELGRVPRSLAAALRHIERALDSDATESSSGGDTDTEELDNDVSSSHDYYVHDADRHRCGVGGAWEGETGAWTVRAHHLHLEQPRSALRRSTAWLWARERAMVASRWTWLTAQVSDLEYRIRQHNELYRQIRASKGPVVLGDPQAPEELTRPPRRPPGSAAAAALQLGGERIGRVEMPPCGPALLLSNLHKQSSRLKQSLGGLVSPVSPASSAQPKPPPPQLNGVVAGAPSCARADKRADTRLAGSEAARRYPTSAAPSPPPSPPGGSSCVAARTRPLRELRRRRVLRASNAYFLSRKAQRPVTVRCSCEQPLSCVACASPHTTQQPMNLDAMTLPERAAMLSPSTHPVLSLPNDIPLHLHFESLMKRTEWHKRMFPKCRTPAGSTKGPSGVPRPWAATPGSLAERKQRHKSDTSLLTTKCDWSKACLDPSLWQYLDSVERAPSPLDSLDTDGEDGGLFKKRRRSGHSPLACKRQRGVRSRSLTLGECPESVAAAPPLRQQAHTPVPAAVSPAPPTPPFAGASTPTSTQASARRRRAENSFDINNIVIPLSMAAFAHVEKIQYKEILTPGWRELEVENEQPDIEEEVEEVEDVSDESFADRHVKFERMEKTRWCFWSPAIHRRTRSFNKSTSEGRCTPQPPSPDVSVSGGGSNHHAAPGSEQRPVELSLRDSLCESTRSSTPDACSEDVFVVVQPWEKRAFPLREQEEIALADDDASSCNHHDEQRLPSPGDPAEPLPGNGDPDEPPARRDAAGAAAWRPQGEERRPTKRSLRSASARQPGDDGAEEHSREPLPEPRAGKPAAELQRVPGRDADSVAFANSDSYRQQPGGRTRAGDGKPRNSVVLRAGRRTNSH